MRTGPFYVESGTDLIINGTTDGMLTIREGATVTLNGRHNGDILNEGLLTIHGVLNGNVTGNGETRNER
jgi:cytoskeletal protein CcmA (bactofilin family)